jgi:hypothetical protein
MTDPNPPLIRRHRLVDNDIIDIAKYIGKDSPDAALRFFDAVDATLLGPSESGMPGREKCSTTGSQQGGPRRPEPACFTQDRRNHLTGHGSRVARRW